LLVTSNPSIPFITIEWSSFSLTDAMKFETISTHLMIAILTRAYAIRKIYILMMIIDFQV